MQYINLSRSGERLVSELDKVELQSITGDVKNNLTKLGQYSTSHFGTDIPEWIQKHKNDSIKDEHPLCWLTWLHRTCNFIYTISLYVLDYKVKPDNALKNAYEQTLKQHHNMIAVGIASSSFILIGNKINGKEIDWPKIKTLSSSMLDVLNSVHNFK